ncbi:ATP-binding protein [Xylanibacter caecicola]|uniref:ATP-binding protein n=1 Tax=Xylanibacter caecicola TaxID=2736294 RepID=UPI002585C288|nr:ATP-binding protein [Xylanibacter caecicola]
MDSNVIYKTILDQREELSLMTNEDFVYRNEVNQISLNTKQAQVVIGVRRSGKSTLCHMALRNAGIVYGYVNFDDDRMANLMVEDLNFVLEAIYRVYGNDVKHIFFDEIQNVDGWHLFINRLLRQGLHIVITGSNARLLSSELATHLTGRYNEIRLFPFSFRDYCVAKEIETDIPTTKNMALLKNTLDEYLIEGGFPEIASLPDKQGYVSSLIDAIITKDIMPRFHIRNANALKTLANHLINNVGQIINMKELVETLKIGSDKTIRNYIDFLAQAFLIVPLTKFSYKSSERLRSNKAYIVDTGMLTFRPNLLATENLGWRLENAVLLELQRRNMPLCRDVFYYRPVSRLKEVDFVIAERGNVMELIQVSYDIGTPKTLSRELSALVDASRKTGCKKLTLIACSETRKEKISDMEINVISAIEWLLTK